MVKSRIWLVGVLLLGLTLGAAVSEAAGLFAAYGKIAPSADAAKVFESFKVLPNYLYYKSGADLYPGAIMGLDRAYTLDSDLWKPMNLTEKMLKEIVGDMQSKGMEVDELVHGFDILGPDGKKIGIWYSNFKAVTYVRMKGDNRVEIGTPPLDIWERPGDRTIRVLPR